MNNPPTPSVDASDFFAKPVLRTSWNKQQTPGVKSFFAHGSKTFSTEDPEVFETMKNGVLLFGLVLGLIVVQSSSLNLYARKTDSRGDARTFSGGILNQKAVEKPNPTYPQAALDARVSGVVVVEILVDEKGIVGSAKAVSGHPLLRQAAVDAAYKTRFVPTRVSGNPVKVAGKLVYRFVRTRSKAPNE